MTDSLTYLGLYGAIAMLTFRMLYATLRKLTQVDATNLRFAALLALLWPYVTLRCLFERGRNWQARRRHHRVCPSHAYGQRDEDLPANPSYYSPRPAAQRYQADTLPPGLTAEQMRSVAQSVLAATRSTPTTLAGHELGTRLASHPASPRGTHERQDVHEATDDDDDNIVWRVNVIRRGPNHVTVGSAPDTDTVVCVPKPPKSRDAFQVFAHGRWREVLHTHYQSWGMPR